MAKGMIPFDKNLFRGRGGTITFEELFQDLGAWQFLIEEVCSEDKTV